MPMIAGKGRADYEARLLYWMKENSRCIRTYFILMSLLQDIWAVFYLTIKILDVIIQTRN